jgi:hypothetical protein
MGDQRCRVLWVAHEAGHIAHEDEPLGSESDRHLGGSNIGQVNPSSRLLSKGTVGDTPPPNGVALDGATPVNPAVTLFGSGQLGSFYFEYFLNIPVETSAA